MSQDTDTIAWSLDSYRMLLTRARFDTMICVPRGDAGDPSRDPAVSDRLAAFLGACGIGHLAEDPARAVMALTASECLSA